MMKSVAKNVMYTGIMKLIVFANISALALEKTIQPREIRKMG